MKKVIFLDRDGTINPDPDGYIDSEEKFALYPYTAEAIKIFRNLGFFIVIVTNQSGIARGYFTLNDLHTIHQKLEKELKLKETHIDEVLISPFHEDGVIKPYNVFHLDRKPNIGMFKKICMKYQITKKNSFMIGDSYSDILFGKNADIKTILVLTGNGEKEFLTNRHNWQEKPDFIVKNILVAANLIKTLSFSSLDN